MESPQFEESTLEPNDAAPVEIVEGVTGTVMAEVLAGPEVVPSGSGVVGETMIVGTRLAAVGETELEIAAMLSLWTPKPTILCKPFCLQGRLLAHYLVLSNA